MSHHKNNGKDKSFGVSDAIRYMIFMAIGLFTSGAGFGGCVVCSVAQGCSWTIGRPSLVVVLIGAIAFMLSTFNLVEGLASSEGDM